MRKADRLSATSWRKSTYSNAQGGDCLEVADGVPNVIPVRDSKSPVHGAIAVPLSSWLALTNTLKHA